MTDLNQAARDFLNASGYPFQRRVRHEIETTRQQHGWWVSSWEEIWRHQDGATGFTDLVVTEYDRGTRLVIECKRQLQGHWVFPVEPDSMDRYRARVLELSGLEGGSVQVLWHDLTTAFQCPEAEFCVIGRKKGAKPELLEDVSQALLDELDHEARKAGREIREGARHLGKPIVRACIVPVVVTNATLSIVNVAPDKIRLSDGMIPSAVDVAQVPYVRLRKSLAFPETSRARTGAGHSRDLGDPSERTVFVVQADHVVDFLHKMRGL